MIWIETFFSHYGAMRCKKMCDKTGIAAKMMPVPRMLSSSCGTCVRMEADCADVLPRPERKGKRRADIVPAGAGRSPCGQDDPPVGRFDVLPGQGGHPLSHILLKL